MKRKNKKENIEDSNSRGAVAEKNNYGRIT